MLLDLGIRDISEYGFDSFQIGRFFSKATISNVNGIIQGSGPEDESSVNYQFGTDVNFLIALGFEGSSGYGSNSHLYLVFSSA
jgi:hypothetical protein